MKCKIISSIIFCWFTTSLLFCNSDTILYVKTEYHHEIFNGRNTAQKYALKQEMRDSQGILFREVFYDKTTKQVDHIFYYFYNKNNTIRLKECVDINEKLTSYYKYYYKKNKLSKIECFNYNQVNNKSDLLTTELYINTKNKSSYKKIGSNNNILISTDKTLKNHNEISSTSIDNNSDSIYKRILERTFNDTLIDTEKEWIISKSNDTTFFYHKYSYNELYEVDTIFTYNKKSEMIKFQVFTYFPGGGIQNMRTIGKNDFYFENITYDLRKYYREELPRKKPLF